MQSSHTELAGPGGGEEWRKGWLVVLTAALAGGIAAFHTQSIGAVMKPLVSEFGWTRTQITTGPFIISMAGLVLAPLTGLLVDRIGPRRVGLVSPWIFGLALILIGRTGPDIWTWYAAFAFIAIVSPAVTPLVWSTAVISRFNRHRGMALGVVIAGVAVLGGFVPVFMTWAIEAVGWRNAYAALGVIAIAVSFPAVLLFFHHADDLRRGGRQDRLPAFAAKASDAASVEGVTFAEAFRSTRFWRIVAVMVVAGAVSGFFIVHLQPLLTDAGVPPRTAALAASGIAPAIVVARLATGWLLDRLFAPYLVAAILIMPIVACVLLANLHPSIALGWTVAMLIGCSMGAEGDAIPFLVSRYFGQRNYGGIYGFSTASYVLGYGGGPLIGARIFDVTGSYVPLMGFASGALLIAALLLLTLGRFPDLSGRSAAADAERLKAAGQAA